MDCASCHTPNDALRRFCRRCGRRLDLPCAACGFANGRDDAFCGGCGLACLSGEGAVPVPSTSAAGPETRPGAVSAAAAPPSEIEGILFGAPPPPEGAAPPAEDAALSQDAIDAIFRRPPAPEKTEPRGD